MSGSANIHVVSFLSKLQRTLLFTSDPIVANLTAKVGLLVLIHRGVFGNVDIPALLLPASPQFYARLYANLSENFKQRKILQLFGGITCV